MLLLLLLCRLLCLILRGSAAKKRWLEDMPPQQHHNTFPMSMYLDRFFPAGQNTALLSLMCLFERLAPVKDVVKSRRQARGQEPLTKQNSQVHQDTFIIH